MSDPEHISDAIARLLTVAARCTPLPPKCEAGCGRIPTRVSGGFYVCSRCRRPDGRPTTMTPLDRILTDEIAKNRQL